MRLFILLLATGLCSCLQSGLEYTYHYRARVTTGIPEINNKRGAAYDIKADLKVYTTHQGLMTLKLENIEHGNYNGLFNCSIDDMSHPLPVEYIYDDPSMSHHPFTVDQYGVFGFHEDETEATTNFLKSVALLFGIVPMRETFFGSPVEHINHTAYDSLEKSTMGECRSTYTQHTLHGVAAAQHEHFVQCHVQEDCQLKPETASIPKGRKTTGRKAPGRKTKPSTPTVACPAIDKTLHKLTRSINLEDCTDRVGIQYYLHDGLRCTMSSDQCKNLYSRNSHGTYYFRGCQEGIRIEKAEVTGTITMSPYGYESEHLMSVSKQKIALVSVAALSERSVPDMNFPTKEMSPYPVITVPYSSVTKPWLKSGTFKEVISSLSGEETTEEMQEANVREVISLLGTASDSLKSTDQHGTNQAPSIMHYASTLMFDFTPDLFKKTIETLPPSQLGLLYNVMGTIGTKAAVEVLLEKVDNITVMHQVIMFGSLNTNLKSAEALRLLLDFVKKHPLDDAPFRNSQFLVNLAKLISSFCGSDKTDAFALHSKEYCQAENFVAELQEYLNQNLRQASKFWKQMVLVRALVNLKTLEATNVLLPYILAEIECDPMVRSVALDSLASWHAATHNQRDKYVLILLDIFENPSERRELRARALGYLVSWELTSTEWTRLAYSTRRPGLKDLSALVYSLIKSTSEYQHPSNIQQRQFAQHALAHARPATNAKRHSSFMTWWKYNFADQVGGEDHVSIVKDPSSVLPSELVVFMMRDYGGNYLYKKMETMISNDDGDIEMIAIDVILGKGYPKREPNRRGGRWTNFINMLKTDLHIEEKVRSAIRGLFSVVPLSGMDLFVPFETEMMQDAILAASPRHVGIDWPAPLYVNPMDFSFLTVNDLGLTVVSTTAMPTAYSILGSAFFMNSGPRQYSVYGDRHCSFLYSRLFLANLAVMLPKTKHQIGAGVSNIRSSFLPITPQMVLQMNDEETDVNSLILTFESPEYKKIPLLSGMNLPYSYSRYAGYMALQDMFATSKIIYEADVDQGKYEFSEQLLGRFKHELRGDMEFFLVRNSFKDIFSGKKGSIEKLLMSPTAKYYDGSITMNLAESPIVGLTFNFTRTHLNYSESAGRFISHYGQDHFEEYELCGAEKENIQQSTGQHQSEDIFGQAPQEEFESFGSFGVQQTVQKPSRYTDLSAETIRPSQGFGDVKDPQLDDFMNYLRDVAGWKHSINGWSLRVEIVEGKHAPGPHVPRAVEIVAAATTCHGIKDKKEVKSVFVVSVDKLPSFTYCLDVKSTAPKLNDLDTIDTLAAKDLSKSKFIDIHVGHKCSRYLGTEEKHISIKPESLSSLFNLLKNKDSCPGFADPVAEFHKRAEYDTVVTNTTFSSMKVVEQYPTAKFIGQAWLYASIKYGFYKFLRDDTCFSPEDDRNMSLNTKCELKHEREWDTTYSLNGSPDIISKTKLPEWTESVSIHHVTMESDYSQEDYCIVDPHHVHTYDGYETNITVEGCPILISTPCEMYEHDLFSVAVKTNRYGGLTVNIAAEYTQLVISMDADGVEVNGEAMPSDQYTKSFYHEHRWKWPQTQIAATVYKRNGFYKVEVPYTFDIILKENKVYLKSAARYRGYLCGLCGNYDLEPSNDLVCPKNCALVNPDNFSKAWTPATGFDCQVGYKSNVEDCFKVNNDVHYTPHRFSPNEHSEEYKGKATHLKFK